MQISLIAAMTPSGVIGVKSIENSVQKDHLPWHIPEELKYFRDKTLGKPVIMGRKTFESIGKLLPNRINIILTRDKNFKLAQHENTAFVIHSIDEALALGMNYPEIMIIGGAEIYAQFLPIATRLYLTTIHHEYAGDITFPKLDLKDWQMIEEKPAALFTTRIYQRKSPINSMQKS